MPGLRFFCKPPIFHVFSCTTFWPRQVEGRQALDVDGFVKGVASCVELLRCVETQLSKLHDAGGKMRKMVGKCKRRISCCGNTCDWGLRIVTIWFSGITPNMKQQGQDDRDGWILGNQHLFAMNHWGKLGISWESRGKIPWQISWEYGCSACRDDMGTPEHRKKSRSVNPPNLDLFFTMGFGLHKLKYQPDNSFLTTS